MSIPLSNARVGIFVDGHYVSLHGGHGMRYDVLREFATRDGAEAVRMNVYVAWDEEREAAETGYRRGQESFCGVLRDFGYKVVRKRVEWGVDDSGTRYGRPGCDMELAIDALLQCEHLERVLIVAGNPDLVPVVRILQNRGTRVEIVAFQEAADVLRAEADMFLSGYMVPNLLPIPHQTDRHSWGELGGKVRGVCYNHSGKGYGFLRYVREIIPGLWITDSRLTDSPYETVFFHDSQLPRNVAFHQLPSRSLLFEFELTESDRFKDDLQAINLRLVSGEGRGKGAAAGEGAAHAEGRAEAVAEPAPADGSEERSPAAEDRDRDVDQDRNQDPTEDRAGERREDED